MRKSDAGPHPPRTRPTVNAAGDTSESDSPANASLPGTGACDTCKQMKIKCERDGDHCSRCATQNLKCTFSVRQRRRTTVKRRDYVETLENRIERLESVVKESGLESSTRQEQVLDGNRGDLSDKFSSLVINEHGGSNYIGAASSFSLFSPRALEWLSEKTKSNDLRNLIMNIARVDWATWREFRSELWEPLAPAEREPLPSPAAIQRLVDRFFTHFNNVFPLYDRKVFESLLKRQLAGRPLEDSAWYASLNIVLAIGSLFDTMWTSGSDRVGHVLDYQTPLLRASWGYFSNARSTFITLFFNEANLLAVQGILGMAFMMQITPSPHPFYNLVAAAARVAQNMGLHQLISDPRLSKAEKDQRRNVFWIAYILDKGASLRSGRPPVFHDEDIGVNLPEEEDQIDLRFNAPHGTSIFCLTARMALIESRIHRDLYSVRSRSRSRVERLKCVGELDADLQRWKNEIPIEIRPEHVLRCHERHFMSVMMLHFSYFHCLTTIHRASFYNGSWVSEKDQGGPMDPLNHRINARVFASTQICLNAARNIIGLVKYYLSDSRPRESLTWVAVYYPLSAALALFANILQSPEDSHAAEDLALMDLVLGFLSRFMTEEASVTASSVFALFQELKRTAANFVAATKSHTLHKTKRGYGDLQDAEEATVEPQDLTEPDRSTAEMMLPTGTILTVPADTNEGYVSKGNPMIHPTPQDMVLGPANDALYDETILPITSASDLQAAPELDLSQAIGESDLGPMTFDWNLADVWLDNGTDQHGNPI